MTEWIEETLHRNLRMKLKVDRVLYDAQSAEQRVQIIENGTLGRVLYLDGVLQTCERDEFIYHEMLTHLPILAHGRVQDLLIIGGGDGGMLEEALKHRALGHVTMVEIDPSVVEMSKAYLPSICGDAFADPRLDLMFADGFAFVRETERRYDVAIVDSTDPIGPGEALFTQEFYAACKRCLRPGGILVTQNGVPFMQPDELRNTVRVLRPLFADVHCYLAAVPGYVGGPMAFGWASDDPALRRVPQDALQRRFAAADIATRYYNPEVHPAAFCLPGYVAELLT